MCYCYAHAHEHAVRVVHLSASPGSDSGGVVVGVWPYFAGDADVAGVGFGDTSHCIISSR